MINNYPEGVERFDPSFNATQEDIDNYQKPHYIENIETIEKSSQIMDTIAFLLVIGAVLGLFAIIKLM